MKILIIANGSIKKIEKYKTLIKNSDKVVCVDGGLNNFAKIYNDFSRVDYLLGDLDSAKIEYIKHISQDKIIKKNNQDESDLEFTFKFIKENFPKAELILIGAIGNRLDHTFANVLTLKKISNANIKIVSDNEEIFLVKNRLDIKNKSGKTLSVIPITDVESLNLVGLKWELSNKNLKFGWINGISNIVTKNNASISLKNGEVLVFIKD